MELIPKKAIGRERGRIRNSLCIRLATNVLAMTNAEHNKMASSAEAGWGISLNNHVLEKNSKIKAKGQRNL